MDIVQVLRENYLPYAKGVIVSRAIVNIDGLKPSQRRILFKMVEMGLLTESSDRAKCCDICGQTLQYHPHGDQAVYETLVRLTADNESLNTPYIDGKGNFSKVYSKSLKYAASRYTEAKLKPICKEMFEGIDENAVDMVNNYNNTLKEPTVLPVKFPTVIVNPSDGIAVGTSSNIPSFDLACTCKATKGILDGEITNAEELVDVLGSPEFTTGGFIHIDRNDLINLAKTGKQSFKLSGKAVTYPNRIEITEIPYKTDIETIIDAIEEKMKSGELKEVSNVEDEIGINGFKFTVELKRGANSQEVLKKLYRYTNLRMNVNFSTKVIIDGKCREIGIFELLVEWIKFRKKTVLRMQQYRVDRDSKKVHKLEAWEIVKNTQALGKLTSLVSDTEDELLVSTIMKELEFDEIQTNYILGTSIRNLSETTMNKRLKELSELRANIDKCNDIINNDESLSKLIGTELDTIAQKYGKERKTQEAEPVIEEKEEEVPIDNSVVTVVCTKNGYLKRLISNKDIDRFMEEHKDNVYKSWQIQNDSFIGVFTSYGEGHKILVDSIDASKNGLKDKIANVLTLQEDNKVVYIDSCDDCNKYFNIIYGNGKGTRVFFTKLGGKRSKYVSLFDKCEVGKAWVTTEDKFFLVTKNRKASYTDLNYLAKFGSRINFKVARLRATDIVAGIQPLSRVTSLSEIDLERYNRDYCVCIRTDKIV